ncbi:unnamed protein product [Linum tenue]|uniref:K Homology domain-containing protein n=1 Tax=Linum tenue TaxID=586396 RepID=A0AAV0N680_9ROSI|nr:unnamed protein product [Linum tenue]
MVADTVFLPEMAGQRNSYGKRSHSYSDYDDGRNKRRNSGEDRDPLVIDPRDTVYRYLCPGKRIGTIIGKGGEIVKQLRLDTNAKIRIGDTIPGCDDRVVTIYSSSDEANPYADGDDKISPAQDALFRVHDRVVGEDLRVDADSEEGGGQQVTARLLVPSDQIGCIIGRGGQIVQSIRTETRTQIRILKDDHLPLCALSSDELVQISGEAGTVKTALYQIAARLHENPSRSQHLLVSAVPNMYPSGGSLIGPTGGAPIVGMAPLMSPYGGYKSDARDWSRSLYSTPREELPPREFSLRMVCPSGYIGAVIGKGGAIINQIRQETGAGIKVHSSAADDCLITISAREVFDEQHSPTIEAALRLQPRCSEKTERDSGLLSFTTRLLVPSSRIGCLLGKGGAIINEMRNVTNANIRILGKDNVPKVAADDDEMVQISGELDVAKDALIEVSRRLRDNVFDRDRGAASAYLPVLPYVPVSTDVSDDFHYDARDSRRVGRGHTYAGGYALSDYPASDTYGSYSNSQIGGSGGPYGPYGSYSSARASTSGYSNQAPTARRRNHY